MGDLVSDGRALVVRRQSNRVTQDFGPPKGKRARRVPCHPDLLAEIQELIRRDGLKRDQTIFRNHEGRPVCHDNFADRQFQKDLKVCAEKRIRFHDLRHTATTLMIANGVDIKTVKEICGHTDISTTINYVHLVSDSVERVPMMFSVRPAVVAQAEFDSTKLV